MGDGDGKEEEEDDQIQSPSEEDDDGEIDYQEENDPFTNELLGLFSDGDDDSDYDGKEENMVDFLLASCISHCLCFLHATFIIFKPKGFLIFSIFIHLGFNL